MIFAGLAESLAQATHGVLECIVNRTSVARNFYVPDAEHGTDLLGYDTMLSMDVILKGCKTYSYRLLNIYTTSIRQYPVIIDSSIPHIFKTDAEFSQFLEAWVLSDDVVKVINSLCLKRKAMTKPDDSMLF